MSYSTDHLRTAGKITVYTTFIGVVVFAFVFIFNLGETNIRNVDAQSTATTTITVLNTPPAWTVDAYEFIESSTDNPTNAGDQVIWSAVGTDANGEDYYLLICSTNASPTAVANNAPFCTSGIQWAVSTATLSGTQASAATTSLDAWAELNDWYAWICDDNAGTPRCNIDYKQGINATNSSPFVINHRPVFTSFSNNSPAAPGQPVTFSAVAYDDDVAGAADTVRLFVCATEGFSNGACTGTELASSTLIASDPDAIYTIVIPTQDQDYNAYGYIVDNHGFEASGGSHGTNSTLTVSNVAPTVSSPTISINDGLDMILTNAGSETPGFTLSFVTSDNNSCEAAGGGPEVVDFDLSLYRSGVGSTTCAVTGPYDPNNCYPSSVATTTWNLECTPDISSCGGSTATDMTWNCTFPLWYIADPTGGAATSTPYYLEDWRAQVRAIDDGQDGDLNSLTGLLSESTIGVNVNPLLAFALNTLTIAYGALEPGQQNDPLSATTTVSATGNVGIDKDVQGESMCETYTSLTPCVPSSTSTIPVNEQRFGLSQLAYGSGTPLSSTTPQLIDLNVLKSTATSTQATGSAYWGIRVPGSITYAGDYTGENTFTVRLSAPAEWY